jgi:hypothetical protein
LRLVCYASITLLEIVSLEDDIDTISRGWDSVGRRLAGAATNNQRSLPGHSMDDEAEPLHPPNRTGISSSTNTAHVAASSASSDQG